MITQIVLGDTTVQPDIITAWLLTRTRRFSGLAEHLDTISTIHVKMSGNVPGFAVLKIHPVSLSFV